MNHSLRPIALKLAAITTLLLLSLTHVIPALADEPRPNIILIFTDDQGYQDLGCFGSTTIKTPHLDQMAAEGVRLTSFYAQPVCGVSRAALMSGSYPIRVAEPGNIKRLHTVPHPKETTMAEVLKNAGYATGMIGKWHLGLDRKGVPGGVGPATMPNALGFDYFYGTPKFNGFTVFVHDTKMRSSILRNQEVVIEEVKDWTGVRTGKWKLVLPRGKAPAGLGWWGRMIEAVPETMLFDLDNDPGESTNVEPRVEILSLETLSSKRNCVRDNSVNELVAKLKEAGAI